MAPATAEVLAVVLALPREDREALRDELDRSLTEPGDAERIARAWAVELDRRAADHDAGRETSKPAAQVRAEVEAELRDLRATRAG